MKLGMFTSGYQRNPLEHCFQDAKRFGYDFIELWGGRPHAYAPDLKAGVTSTRFRCWATRRSTTAIRTTS